MKRRRTKSLMHGLLGKAEVSCSPVVPAGRRVQVCVRKPEKPGPAVSQPGDVCKLLRGAKTADRESLYAVHLDASNKVIGVEEVSRGTLTETLTTPRELFKAAILTNAAGIIIAHNHPSGNPAPSDADIRITREIANAGRLLGIPLRDHVIVSYEGCTSLRADHGSSINFAGATTRRRKGRRR